MNHAKIKALVEQFMNIAVQHYADGEPSRDKVFEFLNALAISSATIIIGTDAGRAAAYEFFTKALAQQLVVGVQPAEEA